MPLLLLLNQLPPPASPPPGIAGGGFRPWQLLRSGVDLSAVSPTGSIQKRSLSVELTRGGRGVLSAAYADWRTGPLPLRILMDQEISLLIDGIPEFAGYVTDVGEGPISGLSGGTRTQFRVGDYSQVFDFVTFSGSFGTSLIPILNSSGAPAILTTNGPHGFTAGQRILIENHEASVPDINGAWTVTAVQSPTNFSIPVNMTAAGGAGTVRRLWTFREVVDAIFAAVLAPWGFTRNADLGPGPDLDPVTFENATIADIWKHFTDLTGYIFQLGGTKVVDIFVPGGRFASFSLDASNIHGPVEMTKTRSNFANRIIVEIGGDRKVAASQSFVATGIAPQAYTTDYRASLDNSDPWPNSVIVNGSPYTVASWGPDPAFRYYWDAATHTLWDTGAGAPAIPAGAIITLAYTQQFPLSVIAEDPLSVMLPPFGKGPRAKRIQAPRITNIQQAQVLAQGELRRSSKDPWRATVRTLAGLARPGWVIPFTALSRSISDYFIVESVKFFLMAPQVWVFNYVLTQGLEPVPTWQDGIKELTGRSGVSTGSIGT